MISLMEQAVMSFTASLAFAMIFHSPKKLLVHCGFVGMCGWIAYYFLIKLDVDSIPATVIAAFLVSVISHLCAKRYKSPVIVFTVSGIIPLVPGGMAYDAMRHFVQNSYNEAISLAAQAFLVSGSIAIGLVFSEVLNILIKRMHGVKRQLKLKS